MHILYIFSRFIKNREENNIKKVKYICILKLKQNLKKRYGFLVLFYIENDQTINIDIMQFVNSANLYDRPILRSNATIQSH